MLRQFASLSEIVIIYGFVSKTEEVKESCQTVYEIHAIIFEPVSHVIVRDIIIL